jgi:drug/metabolite transporter (DMT)-like permease
LRYWRYPSNASPSDRLKTAQCRVAAHPVRHGIRRPQSLGTDRAASGRHRHRWVANLCTLSEIGPIATAFWRVALALVPLFIMFRATKQHEAAKPEGWKDRVALVLPGVFLAADLIAWHASIHVTTVANATLLANLAPVFETGTAWLFLGASLTRAFLIGPFVAIIGIVVLKGGLTGLAAGNPVGDALAILAAMFYAGYMLALRVMLWSTLSAAICLLPVALATESQFFPVTRFGWAMLLGLALISHVGGQIGDHLRARLSADRVLFADPAPSASPCRPPGHDRPQ